jgi:predicted DNA binding protein
MWNVDLDKAMGLNSQRNSNFYIFFIRYHAVLIVIHLAQICGCVYIVDAIKLAVEKHIMIIAPCITGFVH